MSFNKKTKRLKKKDKILMQVTVLASKCILTLLQIPAKCTGAFRAHLRLMEDVFSMLLLHLFLRGKSFHLALSCSPLQGPNECTTTSSTTSTSATDSTST